MDSIDSGVEPLEISATLNLALHYQELDKLEYKPVSSGRIYQTITISPDLFLTVTPYPGDADELDSGQLATCTVTHSALVAGNMSQAQQAKHGKRLPQ